MQKNVFADLLRKYKTALTSNSVMKEAWTGLDFIVFQCFSNVWFGLDMFGTPTRWLNNVKQLNIVKPC
jgi:hypothetical protein